MKRRMFLSAAVAATLLAGCSAGPSRTQADASPTPAPPTSTPSVSPAPAMTATAASRPAVPRKLRVGAKGPAVLELQQRLIALGYWNGRADGSFGSVTQQAVYALQKAAGLTRDGVVGAKTQKALDAGVRPTARSKKGHVVEIDKSRQLLLIVDNGHVSQIFNTSTGSGKPYDFEGKTYTAFTPTGHFRASRQIDGVRKGPLGELYRPKYFNGGIAVHGAPAIPPYPASHGCARLSNAAMDWIWSAGKIPLKTPVWVY